MNGPTLPQSGDKHPRFSEADLVEAIAEDEARLGRQLTPRERVAFAQGFQSTEYRAEIKRLVACEVRHGQDGS